MTRGLLVISLVGWWLVAAGGLVWGAPDIASSARNEAAANPSPAVGAAAAPAPASAEGDPADVIPRSWLQKPTSVEEAEKQNLVTNERLGSAPVPFGFINARWVEFKGRMQAGDELWEFSSSADSWEHLAGRGGLCIVRQGRIIDCFVTIMN
ncbi:MAG: hypothetical protein GX442_23825 [Candidatus Riflebacteria bacterium]|nr:hypothetical protein [Candidatus Riflebacteria bacterium]